MKETEKFVYNESKQEYVIRLKKKNYWWLLLFLLLFLPLILLIQQKKDIVFKTIDNLNNNALADADVKFFYIDRDFINLETFSFFTKDSIELSGKTDENGLIVFENVNYSLYSKLFFNTDKSDVFATQGCFMGDSLRPYFHKLENRKEETLVLTARAYDLDFLVIDSDDNQPIPDADLSSITFISGNENQSIAKTNSNGNGDLNNLIYCSDSIIIVAQKYGYKNDTLISQVDYLTADLKYRTLFLEPIKDKIDFTVLDLASEEPVANATAELIIQNDTVEITTNTNGIGKGFFEDLRIINEMQIEVTHISYYDTITDVYIVEKFIELEEGQKNIYIRPKTSTLKFRNLDGDGNILAGVSNEIYINSTKIEEQMSNSFGTFSVPDLNSTDKITIYASKTGYEENKTKVVNKSISDLSTQSSRDIPLEEEPPPPTRITPPTDNCRAHFSGTLLSDKVVTGHISKIYVEDKYGEYVGEGEYPSNKAAFPKAVARTFDGIAIDDGTRVIIYSEPNFKGTVVLDLKGPAVINNMKWKEEKRIKNFTTKTFDGDLEANFPKSSRIWSSTNMNDWDNGSLKIICD